MDHQNRRPLDYYLLPRLCVTARVLRLGENNGIPLDAYRCETLEPFFRLVARHHLLEAT